MSEEDRSIWQQIRDWGNTNPTKRAVAGFIPAVGQGLDAIDIMDPEADMRTRAGHIVTAMPWGKIGKVIQVLRKGKKGDRASDVEIDWDNPTPEQKAALEAEVSRNRDTVYKSSNEIEAEVAAETLRQIRKAAVPAGATILGSAAAAKYWGDEDD